MRRWSTSLTHARSDVFHESDVHTNVMYTFVHTQPERGMDYQRFEWDDAKAESNLRKHGITFDQATEVFSDPFALTIQDRIEHGEQRWQTLGETSDTLTLLLVAHTLYDDDLGIEVIRIISARRADRQERKIYHGHRQKNLV